MAAPRKLVLNRETLINLHAHLDAVLGGTDASGNGRQQTTVGGGLTSATTQCTGTNSLFGTCTKDRLCPTN